MQEIYLKKMFILLGPILFLIVIMYSMIFESKAFYQNYLYESRLSGSVIDQWNAQMNYAYYLEKSGKIDDAIKEYHNVYTHYKYPHIQDGYLADMAIWRLQYLNKTRSKNTDQGFDWTVYYDN